jgi:hypothetical protein
MLAGCTVAMNLDGRLFCPGDEGDDGEPRVLNSPIDNYIPGRERSVANHLGITVRR